MTTKTTTTESRAKRTAGQSEARRAVLAGKRSPATKRHELADAIEAYELLRVESDRLYKACEAAELEILDAVIDAGRHLEVGGRRVRAVDNFCDAKTGEFRNSCYRAKQFKRFSIAIDAI